MIFQKDMDIENLLSKILFDFVEHFEEWSKLMAKKGFNTDFIPYDGKPMLTIKKPLIPTTEKISIAEKRFKTWTRRGWREVP